MEEIRQIFAEVLDKRFDRWASYLDHQRLEGKEENIKNNQRLARLQHLAQQPCLATETGVKTDTKACKRTKSAAADRAKHGDSSSTQVNDGPTNLTSFDNIAKPLSAPGKCIGDVLVHEGAEAPKPHLPPLEVYILSSTAGGLLNAGTASITMRTIYPPSPLSWSHGERAKKRTCQTNFNQLAPPCWRKVV